jgi:D-amino-acid oxidase
MNEAIKSGIKIERRQIEHIDDCFEGSTSVSAVFNCTGLGSYSLGGVEDHDLYPTKVSRKSHF